MAVKQKQARCAGCDKSVMALSNQPSTGVHIILSIISGGIWLIGWILFATGTIGKFRCSTCGAEVI